jgi:ankyrin repeat protein
VQGGAPQPGGQLAEQYLAALREQDRKAAARLLVRHPEIARANFWSACAAGAAELVAARLAEDATLAVAPHEPHGWTSLLYLCAAPVATGSLRCAELLLAHRADPNSYILFNEDPQCKLPALYFACMSDNVAVVRLLLERGADPNDGESIYHAAEHDHRACLELLLAHGADLSSRHSHWGNTPLYFLAGYTEQDPHCAAVTAGMRWLLEHGADPNVTSTASEETPLHRMAAWGRGREAVELFLSHGAAVDQQRADGRTAYALAVRAGNEAAAEALRERGANVAVLTPVDELLGACMQADAEAARPLLARHPELLSELTAEDRQVFAQAADEGREASVRLMAELGFDLRWEGHGGGTPLHKAAWRGRPALVRLLLELGAPLEVKDCAYGSTPLGWAAHGSCHCRSADDDYLAVVDLLLAAGASREAVLDGQGEAPEGMASRRVAARLRRAT